MAEIDRLADNEFRSTIPTAEMDAAEKAIATANRAMLKRK